MKCFTTKTTTKLFMDLVRPLKVVRDKCWKYPQISIISGKRRKRHSTDKYTNANPTRCYIKEYSWRNCGIRKTQQGCDRIGTFGQLGRWSWCLGRWRWMFYLLVCTGGVEIFGIKSQKNCEVRNINFGIKKANNISKFLSQICSMDSGGKWYGWCQSVWRAPQKRVRWFYFRDGVRWWYI